MDDIARLAPSLSLPRSRGRVGVGVAQSHDALAITHATLDR